MLRMPVLPTSSCKQKNGEHEITILRLVESTGVTRQGQWQRQCQHKHRVNTALQRFIQHLELDYRHVCRVVATASLGPPTRCASVTMSSGHKIQMYLLQTYIKKKTPVQNSKTHVTCVLFLKSSGLPWLYVWITGPSRLRMVCMALKEVSTVNPDRNTSQPSFSCSTTMSSRFSEESWLATILQLSKALKLLPCRSFVLSWLRVALVYCWWLFFETPKKSKWQNINYMMSESSESSEVLKSSIPFLLLHYHYPTVLHTPTNRFDMNFQYSCSYEPPQARPVAPKPSRWWRHAASACILHTVRVIVNQATI